MKGDEARMLYVNIVRSNRATIAQVADVSADHSVQATGEALRMPTDRQDREVADGLAVGRALEALGKKLQKRAHGKSKHNDDVATKVDERGFDTDEVPEDYVVRAGYLVPRCQAYTAMGKRCRNSAVDDTYCGIHLGQGDS